MPWHMLLLTHDRGLVPACLPGCRVPAEFVQQSPDAANPPTFFLLLSDMSQRVAAAAQVRDWDFWDPGFTLHPGQRQRPLLMLSSSGNACFVAMGVPAGQRVG